MRARRSRSQQTPRWERGRPARNFCKVCFSDWYKIAPGFAESQPYLQKIGANIGWEVMLIIGIALGALLSRVLPGGDRTVACALPTVFRASWARGLAAFVGGFLILFGARLAGGCTSGHMLSGIAQLALSGFLFGAAAFATGVLTASLLLKRANGGN